MEELLKDIIIVGIAACVLLVLVYVELISTHKRQIKTFEVVASLLAVNIVDSNRKRQLAGDVDIHTAINMGGSFINPNNFNEGNDNEH